MTLVASIRAVGRGRPPADAAQRDRPGDRRHRRRGVAARGVLVEGAAGAARRGGDDRRRQLRQRLLRRHPRHRRRAGGAVAAGRLEAGRAARGADGRGGEPRRRGGGRGGAGVVQRAVADRGRRGCVSPGRGCTPAAQSPTAISGSARSRCSCSSASSQCWARSTPRRCGSTGSGWRWRWQWAALSSAVLVANNLRDIPTDKESGKITLAVRLGDARTRVLYQALLVVALALTLVLMLATPWCAVGPGGGAARRPRVRSGAQGTAAARS